MSNYLESGKYDEEDPKMAPGAMAEGYHDDEGEDELGSIVASIPANQGISSAVVDGKIEIWNDHLDDQNAKKNAETIGRRLASEHGLKILGWQTEEGGDPVFVISSEMQEVTPPGREDQVKALKKALPKTYVDKDTGKRKESNPWAVAWASKNKHENKMNISVLRLKQIIQEELQRLSYQEESLEEVSTIKPAPAQRWATKHELMTTGQQLVRTIKSVDANSVTIRNPGKPPSSIPLERFLERWYYLDG